MSSIWGNLEPFLEQYAYYKLITTKRSKTKTKTMTMTALMANEDGRNASEQERNEEERERWPSVPVPVFAYTQKYFEHTNNQLKKISMLH